MGDKDRKDTGSTTHLIEDTRLHSRAVSCTAYIEALCALHCSYHAREDGLACLACARGTE